MHYYIDGYNVIFRILRNEKTLAKQREEIILDLNKKIRHVGLDVTVVFDSQYREGDIERGHYHDIEVLFTSQGQTADQFILEELKRVVDPTQETVVTSDKGLGAFSRRLKAKTETVDEFMASLNTRYKNTLRDHKEKPKKIQVEEVVKKLAKPQKSSFELYLEQFEKKYSQDLEQSPPKPIKKKQQKVEVEKKYASEMERWLDLFSKKLNSDD